MPGPDSQQTPGPQPERRAERKSQTQPLPGPQRAGRWADTRETEPVEGRDRSASSDSVLDTDTEQDGSEKQSDTSHGCTDRPGAKRTGHGARGGDRPARQPREAHEAHEIRWSGPATAAVAGTGNSLNLEWPVCILYGPRVMLDTPKWPCGRKKAPAHPQLPALCQGCGGPGGCVAEQECGEQGWVTPEGQARAPADKLPREGGPSCTACSRGEVQRPKAGAPAPTPARGAPPGRRGSWSGPGPATDRLSPCVSSSGLGERAGDRAPAGQDSSAPNCACPLSGTGHSCVCVCACVHMPPQAWGCM
nr:translation initiation factor IF-2 [Oryctolagus cuniculus]